MSGARAGLDTMPAEIRARGGNVGALLVRSVADWDEIMGAGAPFEHDGVPVEFNAWVPPREVLAVSADALGPAAEGVYRCR